MLLQRPSIAGDHATVASELDRFEQDIALMRAGRIPEAIWMEHRLRFGVYGQRQDGVHMLRSKLPLGLMTAEQLEAFADIVERYGNMNAHLTTRQDIQTHFVSLDNTPDLMRVMNDFAMTCKEACGNVVRNTTASPLAGVSPTEAFDVTPYGMALSQFLLKHPDGQSLGRKFKINMAGDDDPRFNLTSFHDMGLTATLRDGKRGFVMVVGGGLGPVPHEAELFDDFVDPAELLPLTQAILKLFGERGEKKNRARARIKFLVASMGIEQFRKEVLRIRSGLNDDPRWADYLNDAWFTLWQDHPAFPPHHDFPKGRDAREQTWLRTNTYKQSQDGYTTVKIRVPRGDLGPKKLRGLAALMRTTSGEDTLRIGLDQSLYLRWVPLDRLGLLYDGLQQLGLADGRAGGLGDMVTCPGNDSCKLGITSPRKLARSIQTSLDRLATNPKLEQLRMHISGCPNSCAQHQIADIGWFGAARTNKKQTSPHYMLVLGGRPGGLRPPLGELGSGFGNIVTKVPAHRVSEATEVLTQLYLAEGEEGEIFGDFVRRVGFPRVKELLAGLAELPDPEKAPWAYREPGSNEAFVVLRGKGECAGEPVALSDFLLNDAEIRADQAVELLEGGGAAADIAGPAHQSIFLAARALLTTEGVNDEAADIVENEFRKRFYDTGRIFEGVGFYFLESRRELTTGQAIPTDRDRLRRLAVEAGLFVEEANSMIAKMKANVVSSASESEAEAEV